MVFVDGGKEVRDIYVCEGGRLVLNHISGTMSHPV